MNSMNMMMSRFAKGSSSTRNRNASARRAAQQEEAAYHDEDMVNANNVNREVDLLQNMLDEHTAELRKWKREQEDLERAIAADINIWWAEIRTSFPLSLKCENSETGPDFHK